MGGDPDAVVQIKTRTTATVVGMESGEDSGHIRR